MFSMFRKMICLVSFVLVLGLVGNVQAVNWTDAGPDHLWSTPENWSTGTVPTSADLLRLNLLPGPTVANEGVAHNPVVGSGSNTGALTVDGGTLTISKWFVVGRDEGSNGTLNMNSGTINVGGTFTVGHSGSATLNMTGGTVVVNHFKHFKIATKATATGHVNLDGGIITTGNLTMRNEEGSVGTMNVTAGTLITDGNDLSIVQGYIDNGWITAYDGQGTLQLDYDVTNEGKTTLKAIHMLNPNPADGSSVAVSVNQLQWTLPEPNQPGGIVTCDVYFGTNPDIKANLKVVDRQAVESVSITLAPDTTYYWALDLYDSSISTTEPFMLCPIFTFSAENQPPIVNAGADVVTWLVDGVRTKNLDGTRPSPMMKLTLCSGRWLVNPMTPTALTP